MELIQVSANIVRGNEAVSPKIEPASDLINWLINVLSLISEGKESQSPLKKHISILAVKTDK